MLASVDDGSIRSTDGTPAGALAQRSLALRSHFATLDTGRGKHRKFLPWAFTEHGAIMAASILSSPRAVEMTVYVVRAFVRLRRVLASHVELARELDELKRSVADLDAGTKRNAVSQIRMPGESSRMKIRRGASGRGASMHAKSRDSAHIR